MIYDSILQGIGNTPLIKLAFDIPATLYAKLEHLNPSGSIKDRAALFMIQEAERTGKLKPGGIIIEASSGNQGIAAAMIGAAKGYKVIIVVTDKVSTEKKQSLRAYGAEVVEFPVTQTLTDHDSYHSKAMELHKRMPNSFMLNQYFNFDNAQAHYVQTAPEIFKQTSGRITHLFAAVGSGGTINGLGTFLKEQNPSIKIIGVDAETSYRSTKGHPKPYKIEGLGVDYDAPMVNDSCIDEFVTVSDDQAIGILKELARTQGLFVGPASGAAAYAAREYCRTLKPDDVAVTLFTDSGRSYLTKHFYD